MLNERARELLANAKEQVNKYSRANPKLTDLPSWVGSFRPWQRDACDDIVRAFEGGKKLVILDGPPGTGKTLIAETVRRLLGIKGALYVCNSRSLQEQFVGDFGYAALLQGRSNYPTQLYPGRFNSRNRFTELSCADCSKASQAGCRWCSDVSRCPYEIAKSRGLRAFLTVLNTSYYLTECNGPGRFSGRELVVFDECDTLERELMGYVEINVGERRAATIGVLPPDKVTVPEAWLEWVDRTLPLIREYRNTLPSESQDVKDIREVKATDSLLAQLQRLHGDLHSGEQAWVYTGRDNSIAFKPSKVAQMAGSLLWRHGRKHLLMSGSVISPEEIIGSLGWEQEYEVVNVPSPFDPKNRPVYIRPAATITNKSSDEEVRKLSESATGIIQSTPDRVLMHTVSYRLTQAVQSQVAVERPVFYYLNQRDRSAALKGFMSTEGAILISPSFDRGIDLPDELCRVQVICKVPYPNLGDRQVSARLHSEGGQLWYNVQAARTLIQMSGRAVRHSNDWAKTYILDGGFVEFFRKNQWLFPEWWKQALMWRY